MRSRRVVGRLSRGKAMFDVVEMLLSLCLLGLLNVVMSYRLFPCGVYV